jgi:hypothetical protein
MFLLECEKKREGCSHSPHAYMYFKPLLWKRATSGACRNPVLTTLSYAVWTASENTPNATCTYCWVSCSYASPASDYAVTACSHTTAY